MTSQDHPIEAVTPESGDPSAMLRELTDPKTLRALTHPVRLALLEALASVSAEERVNVAQGSDTLR